MWEASSCLSFDKTPTCAHTQPTITEQPLRYLHLCSSAASFHHCPPPQLQALCHIHYPRRLKFAFPYLGTTHGFFLTTQNQQWCICGEWRAARGRSGAQYARTSLPICGLF
eukprot:c23807_g1_i2 orf=90-422(+)